MQRSLIDIVKDAEERGKPRPKVSKVMHEVCRKFGDKEILNHIANIKALCPGLFGKGKEGSRLTEQERCQLTDFMKDKAGNRSFTLNQSSVVLNDLDIEKASTHKPTLLSAQELSVLITSISEISRQEEILRKEFFKQVFQKYVAKGGTTIKSESDLRDKLIYDLYFMTQHENQKLKYKTTQHTKGF